MFDPHHIESLDLGRLDRRAALTAGGLTLGGLIAAGGALPDLSRAGVRATPPSLKGKRVGVASPIVVEVLKEFYDDQKRQAKLKGNGESVIVVDANGDSVKQHTQVDAFVAQKYNAIVFFVLSVEGWESAVKAANKAKIGTFNHSASAIGGITQNVGLDQYAGGYGPGEAAAKWINQNHGGAASVGVLGILNDPQLKLRSAGFVAALSKLAPKAQVVGTVHAQTRDVGASATASMLQAHPEIKVIYSAGDDPGLGALTAATEAGKTDPGQFFIASSDGTAATFEKLAAGTLIQAGWTFLFPFSAVQLQRDIEKFLRGGKVRPTRIMSGQLVTKANLAKVQKLQSNPLSPSSAFMFKKGMRYSDYRLKTNEPIANAFK
ncbi:MAG: ribose transport system substrate-binding protein [Gaiellales bacterium]|jgi:ribose transport system substrate-binding protein|nr:ribose transport system substrate-binding protein [Gaiellales bacterium]